MKKCIICLALLIAVFAMITPAEADEIVARQSMKMDKGTDGAFEWYWWQTGDNFHLTVKSPNGTYMVDTKGKQWDHIVVLRKGCWNVCDKDDCAGITVSDDVLEVARSIIFHPEAVKLATEFCGKYLPK